MTHPLWPLFDLSIKSSRLELRLPTDDEIAALAAVGRAGIHAPDEMPFPVPWTTLPSPAFEHGFAQHHWTTRGTWRPDDWMLVLAVFLDGRPVGSQSVKARSFVSERTVETGSWLGMPFQGRGLGKEMRAAVLAFSFDHLGAVEATTQAVADNARSAGVSRSLGYVEGETTDDEQGGAVRVRRHFSMTVEQWRAVPRDAVAVVGLDACRDLFGLKEPSLAAEAKGAPVRHKGWIE
jgi:RimJ/RimL family protein N-acetyltransferase